MRYRVLGSIEVVAADGAARAIGSPSQRALLALLVARRNTTVAADALIDLLWDDTPPPTARSTLQTYVWRLRRLVGDDLVADGSGYRLVVTAGAVDADRFEALLVDAEQAPAERAIELLTEAVELWRGGAYDGVADRGPLVAAARRLDELHVSARERRAAARLAARDAIGAVADAEAVLAEHRFREATWATLVTALVEAARPAEAVRAVERARTTLAEVGLDVSPAVLDAEARALGIAEREAPAPEPAASPPPAVMGRPAPPRRASSFVGREDALATVPQLLEAASIVTLVGPGGVGKTRLAIEVAARIADRHRLGCRVIELGNVAEGDDVIDAVVAALGLVVDEASPLDTLARGGGLDVLLVLDNAEHVVADVASAVEGIVGGGTAARMIVTSRERLGVDGEHVYVVQPLEFGDAVSPASQLFAERSAAMGIDIDLAQSADLVRRVVDRLDGLPLAIEMAAAQLATASLRELVEMLDDRLDGLTSPRRGADARHRSLGALIDWSLDRLEAHDVATLGNLCAFAGSFTIDDVAEVLGGDAVATVRRLVERSLLATVRDGDRTRFRLLNTVRDHLATRGTPTDERVRSAHTQRFLEAARAADALIATPDERDGRRAMASMLDELRAAHRWADRHDRATALAISAVMHRYAQSELNDEVLGWAERLLAGGRADDVADHVAVAMASAATRMITRGEHERGAALALSATELADTEAASLPAWEAIGDAMLYDGRLDESQRAYRRYVEIARGAGDRWYEGGGLAGLGIVAAYAGQHVDSIDQSEDLAMPPSQRAMLLYSRAELVDERDPALAAALLERAVDLGRSAPSAFIEGVSLTSLASIRGRFGPPLDAVRAYRTAIEHWLEHVDRTHQVTTLRNLVVLFRRLDLVEETAELLGALDGSEIATYGAEAERLDETRRWLAEHLDPSVGVEAAARGRAHDVASLARWAVTVLDRVEPHVVDRRSAPDLS